MKIKRVKYYIVLITMFLSSARLVHASVIINEIQINPTEERFIELYNSGSSSVGLTDWYIQRKTATGSTFGSLISKTYFEGKSISAGGYFLISKSNMPDADIVNSDLTITESNTIQIKNSDQEVASIVVLGDCDTCAPNPIDGKSVQRTTGGSWIVATHTPRAVNTDSSGTVITGEDEEEIVPDTEGNVLSSGSHNKDEPEILKVTTKIIAPKIVTAGIPFSINSLTTTNRKEAYNVGRYVWNFGDGETREVGKCDPFDYLYEYPGEYVLTLSYFSSTFNEVPDAKDKITIKVVPSEIYISSVGNDTDPFIEIENKSNYEVLLSNWVVTAGIHYFIIPDGTTILSNKKIKLSPKITGFVGEDIKYIVVTNPNKVTVATYPVGIKKSFKSKSLTVNKSTLNNTDDPTLNNAQVINLNELGAQASSSKINIPNIVYPIAGLLLIIGIGVASFLLIKKRGGAPDYVEKEIRAEDMTIIE